MDVYIYIYVLLIYVCMYVHSYVSKQACIYVSHSKKPYIPDHAIRQPTELAWQTPIVCVQSWDTTDDGQWTCPKHVEYFIK